MDKNKFDSALFSILHSDWNSNVSDHLQSICIVTTGADESVGGQMQFFVRSLGKLDANKWEDYIEKGNFVFARENWTLEP